MNRLSRPLTLAARRVALILAALASGCIAHDDRGTPLYPTAGGLREPHELAHLSGYVQAVDGKDVSSKSAPFDLLPGCHVVTTPEKWGKAELGGGAVTATTGRLNFVVRMRAGFHYAIRINTPHTNQPSGTLTIGGYEKDADGNTTGRFGPTTDAAEIEACLGQ